MASETHEALIERAREAFEGDERVRAAWIEGSIGRGTSDAWSDVDLHLAIADEAYEGFAPGASEVLSRIARPLGYLDGAFPGGVRIIAASVEGPLRLDLYLERRSSLASAPRHAGHRMLFDREGIDAELASAPPLQVNARATLEGLMRGCFFGAMWPARMWGRGDWGALLMNDTGVVYQFIVPSMLIADGSPEFYREPYHRERFLAPHRRQQVNGLLAEALDAFRGIEAGAPADLDALARFHEHMLLSVWASFRAACEATGAEYPEETEAEYRAFYARELGLELPDLG